VADKGSWEERGSTGPDPGREHGGAGDRDRAGASRAPGESGATADGGRPVKKGFNPAWLLVPAAGVLLGGLGIANMSGDRSPGSSGSPVPTVTVTGPDVTVTRPVAPVGTASAAAGCDLAFYGTTVRPPVTRLQNDRTGRTLDAPRGQTFVVVDTILSNSGTETCYATPGYQRAYTTGDTYYTGNGKAGEQLAEGRAVTQPIEAGKRINGAYVFQVPADSRVSSVRLRGNGGDQWTVVDAG
jgi:hypothetical protein